MNLNRIQKLSVILEAWLDYVRLTDEAEATVNGREIKFLNISLENNRLSLDVDVHKHYYQQLYRKTEENEDDITKFKKKETKIVLSFPQIWKVRSSERLLCPLFLLDVTSCFVGQYLNEGWDLTNHEVKAVQENLVKLCNFDEEELQNLVTREGIHSFLATTFNISFASLAEFMVNFPEPDRPYKIIHKPYLFEFNGGDYNVNLKKDLRGILNNVRSKNTVWIAPGKPSYEYLFGQPGTEIPKSQFFGAFGNNPPTTSQANILKATQIHSMITVQGPPGSGKTSVILNLIAQYIVSKALSLINNGSDDNGIALITSTNNRAVGNVIERLINDSHAANLPLYLEGGKKEVVENETVATINRALKYLQVTQHDENRYATLIKEISCTITFLKDKEKKYLQAINQREEEESELVHVNAEISRLEHDFPEIESNRRKIEDRLSSLYMYESLPLDVYYKYKNIYDLAYLQLPDKNDKKEPWLFGLWRFIKGKTERQILIRTAEEVVKVSNNAVNFSWGIAPPLNRSQLEKQRCLILDRLSAAEELETRKQSLILAKERECTLKERYAQLLTRKKSLDERLSQPLDSFYDTFYTLHHDIHEKLFLSARQFLLEEAIRRKQDVQKALIAYKNLLSGEGNEYWQEMRRNLYDYINAISLVFPVLVTTLQSVRNIMPYIEENCFGLAIADEAGMIPQHQLFPVLVRSRRAVVVGDPLQIEPINKVTKDELEEYMKKAYLAKGLNEKDFLLYNPASPIGTAYHRAAAVNEPDSPGKEMVLKEHYRCQKSIAAFCSKIAGYDFVIKTKPKSTAMGIHLIAYHVEGSIENNVNTEEIKSVIAVIKHLANYGYKIDGETIGIISPFHQHAAHIWAAVTKNWKEYKNSDAIGTIHTFQGGEKPVIILSTRVCPNGEKGLNFINRRPNLLNVAVSRAKDLFILIGNLHVLRKYNTYTRVLVDHIEENGVILDLTEYKTTQAIPHSHGTEWIFDCRHQEVLEKAIREAKTQLIIVSPWIRSKAAYEFTYKIRSTLERGVNVAVVYGYGYNDEQDSEALTRLQELFSRYPNAKVIKDQNRTHEKILICDTSFAVVGSWNWLSHCYSMSCEKKLLNPSVQLRKETSLLITDQRMIRNLIETILYRV